MTCRLQRGFFTMALFSLVLTASSAARVLSPDPRQHVIADSRSGLALFGYDPVGYHSHMQALVGKPAFELMNNGLVWRFSSDANRAVFAADPDAYIPRFGGHDGERVGAGVMVIGDPELFLMVSGEVVFFRNAEGRQKFADDPELRRKSSEVWPEVVRQHAAH
jgi:YHS domain-containing protein